MNSIVSNSDSAVLAAQNRRAAQADAKKAAEQTNAARTDKVAGTGGKSPAQDAAKKQATDGFEKQPENVPVTYNKNTGKTQVVQLRDLMNDRIDSFNKMIQSMIVKQGEQSNLTLFGQRLFVTPEQSAAAAKSIAPGGEYSVDAVAGRILDMAKALSGGDPTKIKELRSAVEKGFKAAGVDFGQKMPEITGQTHSEVMKRFDAWQKEAEQGKTAGTYQQD